MDKDPVFIAANIKDIRRYLESFAKEDDLVAHYLEQALTPVLATRKASLRKARKDEQPHLASPLLEQLSTGTLGPVLYVFDPEQDPELEQKIEHIAEFLRLALKMKKDWKNEQTLKDLPPFLSEDFLKAALSKPLPYVSSDQLNMKALDQVFDKLKSRMHALDRQAGSLIKKTHAPDKKSSHPDMILELDLRDGFTIKKYLSKERFIADHKELNHPFGEDLELPYFEDFPHLYYALCDREDKVRGLLDVQNGDMRLERFYGPEGYPPQDYLIEKIIPFLKKRKIVPAAPGKTGLIKFDHKYVNVFNLPHNVTQLESLNMEDIKRSFSLTNIKKLGTSGRFSRESNFKNCTGLLSLGALEQVEARTLDLSGCSNLLNLGKVKEMHGTLIISDCNRLGTLGHLEKVEESITARNCKNLETTGELKEVEFHADFFGCKKLSRMRIEKIGGNLDIQGTNIREIPDCLKKVEGTIKTNIGEFNSLWKARRAFNKYYGTPRRSAAYRGIPYRPPPY
jgi:hypothetical protein